MPHCDHHNCSNQIKLSNYYSTTQKTETTSVTAGDCAKINMFLVTAGDCARINMFLVTAGDCARINVLGNDRRLCQDKYISRFGGITCF